MSSESIFLALLCLLLLVCAVGLIVAINMMNKAQATLADVQKDHARIGANVRGVLTRINALADADHIILPTEPDAVICDALTTALIDAFCEHPEWSSVGDVRVGMDFAEFYRVFINQLQVRNMHVQGG